MGLLPLGDVARDARKSHDFIAHERRREADEKIAAGAIAGDYGCLKSATLPTRYGAESVGGGVALIGRAEIEEMKRLYLIDGSPGQAQRRGIRCRETPI